VKLSMGSQVPVLTQQQLRPSLRQPIASPNTNPVQEGDSSQRALQHCRVLRRSTQHSQQQRVGRHQHRCARQRPSCPCGTTHLQPLPDGADRLGPSQLRSVRGRPL
jgi:hypothetical protein